MVDKNNSYLKLLLINRLQESAPPSRIPIKTLYIFLGQKKTTSAVETAENKAKIIDDTVERIVAMSKVLFGLHMVRHQIYITIFAA